MADFNDHSFDAVLARTTAVLERVEKRLDIGEQTFKEHKQQLADHAEQIRKLQNWKFYIIGLAAGLAAALRLLWDWIIGGGGFTPPKH